MEETILLDIEKLVVMDQPVEEVSREEKEELKKSIEEVDVIYPLVVTPLDEDDGTFRVLDGRTRLGILKELGYSHVRCLRLDGDPMKNEVIPYDTELFRRHLDASQRKEYGRAREEKKRGSVVAYKEELLVGLAPGDRDFVKEFIGNYDPSDACKFVKGLLELPEEAREAFIEKLRKDPEIKKLSRSGGKASAKRLSEIEAERVEKQKLLEECRRLKEENELLIEGMKADVAKRIKEMEKEVDEKYRRMNLEDKTKLLEEEKERIGKEKEGEINDANNNIEILNRNAVKLQQEADSLSSELTDLKKLKKDDEKLLKKLRRDMGMYKDLLEKATGLDNLVKRFERIRDELQTANDLIVERGFTEEEVEEGHREKLKEVVFQIRDTLSETETIVKQIG